MNWPYIAGFFDGEGCISMPLGQNSINLSITQAGDMGIRTLERMKDFLALHGIKSRTEARSPVANRQRVYRLCLSAKQAEKFLEQVMPYLYIKRTKAQDCLRLRKLYPNVWLSPLAKEWKAEAGAHRRRPFCKRGHRMTPGNLYGSGLNRRRQQCKTCAKERANSRYQQTKSRLIDELVKKVRSIP